MNTTVHFGKVAIPPEEFSERCRNSAAALSACGIGEGDVFALMLYNEPTLLELMLAGRRIGARWCLINWHFKSVEVAHILSNSGARLLVVHADLLPEIVGAIPSGTRLFVVTAQTHTRSALRIAESPPALASGIEDWPSFRDGTGHPQVEEKATGSGMFYTSGTTGLPKGVRRVRPLPEQIPMLKRMYEEALGIESGMRALCSAPLYHSAPNGYALYAALAGADFWLEPRFDAEGTLRLIEEQGITHAYVVPTMCVRLLALPESVRRRYDLSSLRFVASTGAHFPADIKRQMIAWWGPVIHEAYAASELGYITHIDSIGALAKPGSAGRPLSGVTLRILSESGDPEPPGVTGLIYARNAGVPDFTYVANDAARRRVEKDGLITLGDMGYLDDDGFLFVVDRYTDLIISGGVNIYPAEIESVLIGMPGLIDCAVFGIPDDEFGESVMAAVQAESGINEAAVRDYLRERIAGFKVPRRIEFIGQLPRDDSGKIFKRRLRDPFWAGRERKI